VLYQLSYPAAAPDRSEPGCNGCGSERRVNRHNWGVSKTRHIYLLRHAKSSWDEPSLPDHDRPLAERGRQAVKVLARYVEQREIDPDLVLCSSARRTRETLDGVIPGRQAVVDRELFVAGYEQLLQRLRHVEPEIRSVMVVGHNPALQMLTLHLAGVEGAGRPAGADGLEEIRRKLPTGALATLSFDSPWSELTRGSAELEDYVRPKALLRQQQL
jgi:phosphohistidine phosphatase